MKLGLGLICKNEEIDILNCLQSFVPQVDVVCVVDTGSTDNTVEIVEQYLKSTDKQFVVLKYTECNDNLGRIADFSAARNQYIFSLEKLGVDYILTTDSDDTYIGPSSLKMYMANNPADIYSLKYLIAETQFFLTYRLFTANKNIHFVGRVHEYLHFDWSLKITHGETEIEIRHNPTSHANQELSGERNRRILKPEIYPSFRSMFYWANEHLDIGELDEAIKWYLEYIRRFKAGEDTFLDELAHCYFRAARWLQHLSLERNRPELSAQAEALSHELLSRDPSWSESWCELAYIARLRGDFAKCKKYALRAMQNKFTPRLFSEQDKYTSTPANMVLMCNVHEQVSPQTVAAG